MADKNVGLRCPKCGDDGELVVQCHQYYPLNHLGEVAQCAGMYPRYDDASPAHCRKCTTKYGASTPTTTVADFHQKSVKQMLLEVAEGVVADGERHHMSGGSPRFRLWCLAKDAIKAHGGGLDG